ncbi:GAF domain-containing protein [Candidatus Woesearchaeota archaeon]|nr:GAF domain-containing protein [Candidatus Woesearchaeota archaeon]
MVLSKKDTKTVKLAKEYLDSFIAGTTLYAIGVADLQGSFVFFNKGAQKLFNYEPNEIVGKKYMWELISRKYKKDDFKPVISEVIDSGSYVRDMILVKKNKKEFPGRVRISTLKDEKGNVVGFVIFVRDLSKRRQVEKDVVVTKHLLEGIFDSITDDVFVLDRKLKIVRCNKALLDRVNKEKFTDVLERKCYKAIYGKQSPCKDCPTLKAFKTGSPCMIEHSYLKKGILRFREIYAYPIKDSSGKVVQVVHYSKDITKRKKLEQYLEKQNARLYFLQEIGRSMHEVHKLGELLDEILNAVLKLGFNRAAIFLVSKQRKMLEGVMSIGYKKDIIKQVQIPIEKGTNNLISKLFQSREPVFVENIFDPNTKVYVAEEWLDTLEGDSILAVPLLMEDEVIGIMTVDNRDKDIDIDRDDLQILRMFAGHAAIAINRALLYTQLNTFNAQLQKKIRDATAELSFKNRRLEEVDRMKTNFLSTISHELKTPLTSIRGYSSLLNSGKVGDLGPEQKKCIEILSQEANRLSELINELLNLTKLESGRAPLKLKKFNMNELVESALHQLKAMIEERKIHVEFEPKAHATIRMDPELIERVLKNLISNAVKYNREGGFIKIFFEQKNKEFVVNIQDTGRGIKKKEVGRMFKKFEQLDEHMIRSAGGMGIGLAVVKSIIDQHNGKIWVRESSSKGSIVSFSIPRKIRIDTQDTEESNLKRNLDELRSVRKVFNVMHTDASLRDILAVILDEIHRITGFDRIRLYILDEKRKALKGEVAIGMPNFERIQAKISNYPIVQHILKTKQAEIYDPVDHDPLEENLGKEFNVKSAVMPIIVKGKTIGVIAADNALSKKEITNEDLKSLTVFANSAAITIENFRLYEETEKKVAERTRQLTKLNRQKDEFVSYVSHELRTPLTSLLGYSKLLLSEKLDGATKKQSAEIIYSEANRLKDMINNFLDLSKIEAGKIKPEKGNVDIVKLAASALTVMKKQADEKGLRLEIEAPESLNVAADKGMIEQVLLNLLSNAIKFTPKGHVKLTVREKRSNVEVEVKDTGIGIAKKDHSKVFSKFDQIANNLKTDKGTGLGMPIVREIINLHGGRIWIKSSPGKGSSFIFAIPKE